MAKDTTRKAGDAQFAKRVLIALSIAGLFYIGWQLRELIVMLFAAIVVATVFRTIARPIEHRTPLSEKAAVAVAILLVFGLIGAGAWAFGSEVAAQAQTFSETLPASLQSLQSVLAGWGLDDEVRGWLSAPTQSGGSVVSSIMAFFVSLSSGIADTLVVIFGGIFLALQPRLYRIGAVKLVPKARRQLVSEAMDDSEGALQLWLKAQLVSMVVVGVFTTFGLWFIGVPSWLVLGLLAFSLEFIPFAGPIIASVPAILLALAVNPQLALWTIGLYVLVQQMEGNVVYPLVQQWAVKIPAAVLLFSLIAFASLFGVVGVIFAAPLTVVTYVLIKRLYVQEALETPTPIPGDGEEKE